MVEIEVFQTSMWFPPRAGSRHGASVGERGKSLFRDVKRPECLCDWTARELGQPVDRRVGHASQSWPPRRIVAPSTNSRPLNRAARFI